MVFNIHCISQEQKTTKKKYIYTDISAVKRLIVINHIQNKSFFYSIYSGMRKFGNPL